MDKEVLDVECKIKDGQEINLSIRKTHLSPILTEFVFTKPGEDQVALKRIPVCERNRKTIQNSIAMICAKNVSDFLEAKRYIYTRWCVRYSL